MIYLIAAICANLCMTFLMRYSEHHNGNCYALNIWNYLAGSLISLLLFFKKEPRMSLQDALIGIGVGIPNQLCTLFLLRAASRLPAYIVYPTYSASLILLVNIINYLVFRETLNKRQYIATGIIGLGVVLINLV